MVDRVAIVVPVYGVAEYLRECIESILLQTYMDLVVVLVDDGSTDGSGEICDEYARKDSRIKVIHKANGGLSSARNAALDYLLKNGSTKWVTFVDGDDVIHPKYLESMVAAATENAVRIAACSYQAIASTAEAAAVERIDYKTLPVEAFWVEDRVRATVACCKLYDLELWREVRFPVGKTHEDEYTTYKVLFAAGRIARTDAGLYLYLQHSASIMGATWSPKRLDQYRAKREQIKFWREHGCEAAALESHRHLIGALRRGVIMLDERPNQYRAHFRWRLLWQLRFEILRIRMKTDYPVQKYFHVYTIAWPQFFK